MAATDDIMEPDNDLLWTLWVATLTFISTPFILFCCAAVRISHGIWYKFVAILHPDVEFLKSSTIRTLVDTHRNQGIIAVLLTVNGSSDIESVKKHLLEVVHRKDKLGKSVFPRLRQRLVTRWGSYAWQNCRFDLEQNLVVSSGTYRGRAISDLNIQDYVSEIVSKYLPQGMSPWQLVIIPSSDSRHYLLLRLHHVLLYEELNIADLFPLNRTICKPIQNKKPLMAKVFPSPKSLPCLKERLQEDLTNRWNEFISNYDPLEKPELIKTTPTFTQFLAVVLITAFSVLKEFRKGNDMIKNDWISKIRYMNMIVTKETKKRQVNVLQLIGSMVKSLDPRNIFKVTFNFWYSCTIYTIKLPVTLYREIRAIYLCVTLKFCPCPETFVAIFYNYGPLIYSSFLELGLIAKHVIKAPRIIMEQTLSYPETLQIIPPCGRKVIAWSDPVKRQQLELLAKSTGTNQSQIFLAAISVTLAQYCRQAGILIPAEVPTVIRTIDSNYIFLNGPKVRPVDSIGGLISLQLPVLTQERNLLENLQEIKDNFTKAVENQIVSYLLTILQTKYGVITKSVPTTIISILLKYLSRKYTVAITEVTTMYPNFRYKTLWGQEVTGAIYWRPPQANMSISLCFNEYDDHVTLGVMCDAQILPNHAILARNFSRHIRDLAEAAGVPWD